MPELTIPSTETPTTPTPVAAPTQAVGEWSDEVKRFAVQWGLTDYIPAAIRIVEESFPPGSEIRLRVQWSPEPDGESLVLEVRTPCPPLEASERFQRLLDRWTAELPLHVQMRATTTYCPV